MEGVFYWFPSGKHAASRPSDYLTKGLDLFDLDFESKPAPDRYRSQAVTVFEGES
jgi:hypothetical protein